MPERMEEVTAACKIESTDQIESGKMNLHYSNNTASASMPQSGRRPANEPMDLVDALSYVDSHPNWTQVWDPRMSTSFTTTKGLLNGPGENNCFLNSAVQVLWHLDVFRRNFRQLSGHLCMGNSCIFCALKVIFTQFQYSDRTTLPPDALRKALACTFADQQKFQIGLMDDAAECFENILVRIHFHIANSEPEDMCGAKHCIPHQKFAMNVVEQIVCSSCGATSEPLPFNQMVYYVSASALVRQAKFRQGRGGFMQNQFGEVLRSAVSQGDYRDCPSLCGEKVAIRRNLINLPDVVSVGIVWDSDRPITEHIHDVMTSIGTTLRLTDLFHSVVDERQAQATVLQLVGVVCYYGKHYSTFFFHSKMKKWISFDDATVREVGKEWSSVVDKCCRGHYQPLLLLYANQSDSAISLESAPNTTVMVNSEYCFNKNNSGTSTKCSHARQRSADRDANDILPGGRKVQTYAPSVHTSKPQHAITPVQRTSRSNCNTPTQRATTPSTDQERDGKSAIIHFRQPSYLIAVDGKENGVSCTCNGSTVAPTAGSEVYSDYDCTDGPSHKYASQTNAQFENGTDLRGSYPLNGTPTNGCYRTPAVASLMQGRFDNQTVINQAIHSRVAEFVHTPSPASIAQTGPTGPSTGSMHQAPNQRLYTADPRCPDYRSQDMSSQQKPVHRSGSLEDIDLPQDGTTYTNARMMALRARPQSARPFDYRNGGKLTNSAPRCANANGETRTMNKMDAWMMSSDNETEKEVYIKSKAVESILKYQRAHQLQQGSRCGSPMHAVRAPPNSTTSGVMATRGKQSDPALGHPATSYKLHSDSVNKTSHYSNCGDRDSASSVSSIRSSQDSTDSNRTYYKQKQCVASRNEASTDSNSSSRSCSNSSVAPKTAQRPVNIAESRTDVQQVSREMVETNKTDLMPNECFEQLCMHAEGLIDSSTRKEKDGDLSQALLYCNRAIGCIQKALALNGVSQESKLHTRVKCNTYVMRSRSLHRKMTTKQDSNDHTSVPQAATDARLPGASAAHVRQPSEPNVHFTQPLADCVHIRQSSMASVHNRVDALYSEKTPKDAEAELKQCIHQLSVSGEAVKMPPGILKKPKQKPPKPQPPVRTSSIEQKKSTTSHIPVPSSQQKAKASPQQPGQFENVTSCIEAYATLPRKPGQRASRQVAAPGLNAEVYESYLQRQRAAASCMSSAQSTVSTSGGSSVRQLATMPRVTNGEEGNHVGSRPRPASACSYRCPEDTPRSTHPSIMKQLVLEGLVISRTHTTDTAPQNHNARDNGFARESDRHVRQTNAQCSRSEQCAQQQGRHVNAVSGRRTPQQGTQFRHPVVEGRRSQKQKQWAVTDALYYGMPTTAVTQQMSCTPLSNHSSQQSETTDGGYWESFPPHNNLRKTSSQGYLMATRQGQQLDSSCSPFITNAPLQQPPSTETSDVSRTQPTNDHVGDQRTPSASWEHKLCSGTNELADNCHDKDMPRRFSSQQAQCNVKKLTCDENVNLMPDFLGNEHVAQHGCHHDDDNLTSCSDSLANDSNVSWSSRSSEVDSLNFNVNSQGSGSTLDYDLGCGDVKQQTIDEDMQDSDLLCGHVEQEMVLIEPQESLPKSGLKPAIKSEEALLKTKKRCRRPRRRVTFSENIALISLADNEEECEAVDYMAYVTSTLVKRKQQGDLCTVVQPSVDPQTVVAGERTGSCDEVKTKSVDRNASDKVQCMLCRKRQVDMAEVYCLDCQLYMSRFKPLISQC